MIRSTTITADYSLRPSALADALARLVEARQPVIVWAPPAFLPPGDAKGRWLVNLEELSSAVPMVQAALYQLMLDRRCGEYIQWYASPLRGVEPVVGCD